MMLVEEEEAIDAYDMLFLRSYLATGGSGGRWGTLQKDSESFRWARWDDD